MPIGARRWEGDTPPPPEIEKIVVENCDIFQSSINDKGPGRSDKNQFSTENFVFKFIIFL